MPIIRSLLDTDVYKFTMMQAAFHQFPALQAGYTFFCRSGDADFGACLAGLESELEGLCSLSLDPGELAYLGGLGNFKPDFLDFLSGFRLRRSHVRVEVDRLGRLRLEIEGNWVQTILFEVPLLAILSELRSRLAGDADGAMQEGRRRLRQKVGQVRTLGHPLPFVDFGTRRRYSGGWQGELLQTLKLELPGSFLGTSNLLFARLLDLQPSGTMGHEFLQAAQALCPLPESQRFALQAWANEYRGRLDTALSDVIGMDAFLRDFDLYFAKLYTAVRQDSGDPFTWTRLLLEHYRAMGLDPRARTAVYSDSLTIPKAAAIFAEFGSQIACVFGIGTDLTNDMGLPRADMVIKMTRCAGRVVAKLSDSPDKQVCLDPAYLPVLKYAFQLP